MDNKKTEYVAQIIGIEIDNCEQEIEYQFDIQNVANTLYIKEDNLRQIVLDNFGIDVFDEEKEEYKEEEIFDLIRDNDRLLYWYFPKANEAMATRYENKLIEVYYNRR